MCGIAGYIHLDGRALSAERDTPVLQAMGAAMEQRGPDDARTTLWENVGFVFRRLSIVDLETGQQPFEAGAGRLCAMVNGEIYNHRALRPSLARRHRFSSDSDCEVIPYLYLETELDLFDEVNGMFATAILDRHKRRLLLARDRVGIKPLFYCLTTDGGTLVFASELKALFAHPGVPRQFDWHAALSQELTLDTCGVEIPSFFKGIERLPAGHVLDLSLENGNFTVSPYWRKPTRESSAQGQSARDYIAQYRELLEDSVRLRLMSDVDLGVFLSGGVDSAAVAALAAQHRDLPSFSVSCHSTVGSGDVAASMEVARHLGQVNHQVFLDTGEASLTPDHWRELLWACEFPLLHAEQLYKYALHAFAKRRYPNLKVMLLGQGADEFTGGYMERTLEERLAWEPAHWKKLEQRMRDIENDKAMRDANYEREYRGLIQTGVLSHQFLCQTTGRPPARTTLDMYQGYYRQNLDYHLWHEDRTASAHSIESRVPFLDHRLLELIARVPEQFHAQLFTDKRIVREAVADLLPENIVWRPKGHFYYGREQHHTFALLYGLLVADDRALVEQAIAGSAATDGPLVADQVHDYVSAVGQDALHTDIHRLLKLVNMGVMADMVTRLPSSKPTGIPFRVMEITHEEAARMTDDIGGTIPEDDEFLDDLVPIMATSKPRNTTGDTLIVDASATNITSPSWEQFLRAINGEQTVGQIISQNRLPRHRTIRYLRQAVKASRERSSDQN